MQIPHHVRSEKITATECINMSTKWMTEKLLQYQKELELSQALQP